MLLEIGQGNAGSGCFGLGNSEQVYLSVRSESNNQGGVFLPSFITFDLVGCPGFFLTPYNTGYCHGFMIRLSSPDISLGGHVQMKSLISVTCRPRAETNLRFFKNMVLGSQRIWNLETFYFQSLIFKIDFITHFFHNSLLYVW